MTLMQKSLFCNRKGCFKKDLMVENICIFKIYYWCVRQLFIYYPCNEQLGFSFICFCFSPHSIGKGPIECSSFRLSVFQYSRLSVIILVNSKSRERINLNRFRFKCDISGKNRHRFRYLTDDFIAQYYVISI